MKLFNVLLKKELATQLFGDAKGKKRDIPGGIISTLISLAFLALFVFLFVAFQREFAALSLENEVLIIFAAIAITAQIIFALSRTAGVLYGGADAKVVLPLPISNLTMLTAKLAALWIKELVNSCFFLLPVILAYGIMSGAGVLYYFGAVAAIILASLFIVSVASLIAPLFIKIKEFISRYPLPVLIVSLIFFAALFLLYSRVLSVLGDMLVGNRLRFLFNTGVAAGIRKASLFMVYSKQIGDMLRGNILAIAIVVVVTAGAAVGAYFLSSRFYLAFLKANTARTGKPAKTRKNAVRGTVPSLIIKELTEIFRSPALLFSYLSVVLTLPMLCYITLGVMRELVSTLLGGDFVIPFSILILVMFSCICNTSAGDVISREENRIMIVKTIPVPYKTQVAVKAGVALAIALFSDLLTIVLLAATGTFSVVNALVLFLLSACEVSASILRLISRDVSSPAAGKNEENVNVTFSVIRSLVMSVVLGGFAFIMAGVDLYSGGNAVLGGIKAFNEAVGGVTGVALICAAVAVIDLAVSVVLLLNKLDERMRRIKI